MVAVGVGSMTIVGPNHPSHPRHTTRTMRANPYTYAGDDPSTNSTWRAIAFWDARLAYSVTSEV